MRIDGSGTAGRWLGRLTAWVLVAVLAAGVSWAGRLAWAAWGPELTSEQPRIEVVRVSGEWIDFRLVNDTTRPWVYLDDFGNPLSCVEVLGSLGWKRDDRFVCGTGILEQTLGPGESAEGIQFGSYEGGLQRLVVRVREGPAGPPGGAASKWVELASDSFRTVPGSSP